VALEEGTELVVGKVALDVVVWIPAGYNIYGLDATNHLFHVLALDGVLELGVLGGGGILANLLQADEFAVAEVDTHLYALGGSGGGLLGGFYRQVHQVQGGTVREAHQFHVALSGNISKGDGLGSGGDMGHSIYTVIGADLLGLHGGTQQKGQGEDCQFLHGLDCIWMQR